MGRERGDEWGERRMGVSAARMRVGRESEAKVG